MAEDQKNQLIEIIKQSINIESVIKKYNTIKGKRNVWETKWNMIQQYVFPKAKDYLRGLNSRDSQAQTNYANFTSAVNGKISRVVSMINSQLCDPSVEWLGLNFIDPIILADGSLYKLSENDAAKRWLKNVSDIINKELTDPDSNFYPSTNEFLFEWYTIGTACREVIIRNDTGNIRFNAISMQDIFIDTNGYGEIDDIYRSINVTPKQAYDLWGENIHESEKRKLFTESEGGTTGKAKEYVEVTMRNPALAKGFPSLPYVSCVIDKTNKILVDLKLHQFKPYIVSRFFITPGEDYGRSPVWNAMPDIIKINIISKRILTAYDYSVAPPILVRDWSSVANYQLAPNTFVQGLDENGRAMMQPMALGTNLPFSIDYYSALMNELDDVLMARDIFSPESPNMTATEVTERKIQASNRMRPILVRLEYEDLNNTIRKTFSLLAALGKMPQFPYEESKIPAELLPDPTSMIRISFSGQISRMQKLQDVQNNDIIFNKALNLAQVDPKVMAWINFDSIIRKDAEILGVSTEVIESEENVIKIREAQREAEEAQSAMNQATQQLDAQIKMKEAGLDEETAF